MPKPAAMVALVRHPCTEDWDAMNPTRHGRHCASCNKIVIDFSTWSDTALAAFLAGPDGQDTCGRYRASQLNRPLHLPHQPHSLLYRWILVAGLTAVTLTVGAQTPRALLLAPTAQTDTAKRLKHAATPNTTSRLQGSAEIEILPWHRASPLPVSPVPTRAPYEAHGDELVIGGRGDGIPIITNEAIEALKQKVPSPLPLLEPPGRETFSGDELERAQRRDLNNLLQ